MKKYLVRCKKFNDKFNLYELWKEVDNDYKFKGLFQINIKIDKVEATKMILEAQDFDDNVQISFINENV